MAKKSKKAPVVDFSNVTSIKIPKAGTYPIKVEDVTLEQGQNGPYLKWTFSITSGDYQGSKLWHNTSLAPQALFSLKDLLEALGLTVPKSELKLNLNDYMGLTAEAEVDVEVYEGKKRPRIISFIEGDGAGAEDDLEEALAELDLADLKALAKELKIKVKKKADVDAIIDLITDAVDEEELEEDEVFEAIDELFGEEDEDDEEEDEDDEDEEVDYSDLSLKELKAEAKSRGIKVKKSMDEDDIIELLEEDDEE